MNVDVYTKTILTVIAACLVWICANGIIPAASAQAQLPPPTRVLLVDERNVAINTANGLRVNMGSQAIPVELSQVVPVAVTAIQRQGTWQPIIVDVLKQPPTLMPTP